MAFLEQIYTKADSLAIQNGDFLGYTDFTDNHQNTIGDMVYENAVIALAVMLSQADGAISKAELDAFTPTFMIFDSKNRQVRDYFMELGDNHLSVNHYISRIKQFFPHDKKLQERIVSRLFALAIADSPINAEEIIFLKKVADGFSLSHEFFIQKLRLYMMPLSGSPHQILGVSQHASIDEINHAYHKAVHACHPERLSFLEPSGDITIIANTRINTLATAYYVIKKHMRKA